DEENNLLTTGYATMDIGRIISRQLRGSSAFAFFVATAGMEFEHLQEQLKAEGDMVSIFIADAMGSVIAEKAADCMERVLQDTLNPAGMKRTNRFSPGYCGWHVSQQHLLFSHFPTPQPCGITLSDSSLMTPIKSVSGIIGIGATVRHLDYTCGLCDYKDCYKRRKK
ncbi:MAG: methionine synthase, partial [Prevotella sp.]|nr:methionine synthase [Prevotella sp.]